MITSIKERYHKTGKLGVSGEELKALKEVIEFNREFWKMQPGEVFDFAVSLVEDFYRELREKAA